MPGGSRDAELLTLLVGSVVDYAIFVLDPQGRIATWNPGAERIKGWRADEIIGQHFSRFYPPDDVAADKPGRELVVATAEGRFEDEGWRLRKDGSRFWASVVITALRDATGELRGFAKVTRDLTERKRCEERARELAAEQAARATSERLLAVAESANQAKDEFLAILGHELRNPLSPIVTALEVMRLRDPQANSRELEIIERQVRHVTRLVEDLLDVSRIAQGKISLRRDRVQLGTVVARAVELAEPLIEQRRHRLALDLAPDVQVEGDLDRLTQVCANLLTNAAKYTQPEGRIDVRVTREKDSAVIAVTDDGEGIDAELLPCVFDLFTQTSQTIDRRQGGLGLGLAVVRGLVHLHGGTVTAASEGRGRGSTFTVRLAAVAPRSERRTRDVPASAATRADTARRILVVEDNHDAAIVLREGLRMLGHDVRVAHDGPGALDVVTTFTPDLALVDIGLPVMDGYELARRLRAMPGLRGAFLVALTGYGRETDRARALAAGFDEHLVKPVELARLRQLLQSLRSGGDRSGVSLG